MYLNYSIVEMILKLGFHVTHGYRFHIRCPIQLACPIGPCLFFFHLFVRKMNTLRPRSVHGQCQRHRAEKKNSKRGVPQRGIIFWRRRESVGPATNPKTKMNSNISPLSHLFFWYCVANAEEKWWPWKMCIIHNFVFLRKCFRWKEIWYCFWIGS